MKKIFLLLASISLFFSFGDRAAAEQNAGSRNEIATMEKKISELQARVAEMTMQMNDQEKAPLAAPADAAAGPCYDGTYHSNHDYRCYQGYRKHYTHH